MKKYLQFNSWALRLAVLTLLIAMSAGDLQAQQRKVSGKVVLEDGEAVPGVSIFVKGTSTGTVTDSNGNYTVTVSESDVLIFSFIGLITQEETVGSRAVIDVTLQEDIQSLDEIVVVGYGEQKKSTLTTSVSTISGDDLSEYPVADVGQALQGRAAGVNITNNGSPGGRTLIRIRGLSTFGDGDPLVVVDGVFLEDAEDLRNINPSSIEKIDVLKDAAATAVYGSRGANGVVIVSTDRGTVGKTTLKLKLYGGIQYSNQRYDVLDTDQYIQFLREIAVQESDGAVASVISDPAFDGGGVNTNWQDELFRTGVSE